MKKSAFLIFIGLCIISPAHPNLNAQNNDLILAYDGFPAWSPDGTHIAFVSGRSGNYDLWVMNTDGSNPANLTQTPDRNELSPCWSPDGQHIAYIAAPLGEGFYDPIAGQAYNDLWVMRRDGTNRILLSTELEGGSGNPEWSPDEQAIAFISGIPSSLEEARQFQSNIWLVEPDGLNLTNLTNTQDETYTDLSWSPDSRQLAFIDSSQGILLYNLDNQQTTVLTSHRIDTEVAWADDFLAVTTMYINDDDIYSIWSMNSDGTNRLILTRNNPGLDWHPVWSPDSERIVYESSNAPHNYGRDIWIVDRDGYNAANLTADLDGWSMKPNWSPDGQQIVFEYNEGDFEIAGLNGESDIWIMNADGSGKTNLTGQLGTNSTATNSTNTDETCPWLRIAGQIMDETSAPLLGIEIHVESDVLSDPIITTSGTAKMYGPSGWEIALENASNSERYRVSLWTNNSQVSETIAVDFRGSCEQNLGLLIARQTH